jgi:hypothetical protein
MTRPWPVTENEFLLDDALDIAMRYFDLPPDSAEYASVEKFAVDAIMDRPQPRRLHQVLVFAGRSIEAPCPSSRRARLHHPHGIRSSDKRRLAIPADASLDMMEPRANVRRCRNFPTHSYRDWREGAESQS